jgi:cytochrome c oxidase assembly protein subunit 15
MPQPTYNPALHRVALLTTAATFPLIFMGGRVTTMGAGMSVPDWPNSFGYNMFLFPPSQWVGGILYEHTHRLMGTVVGFLSIILVSVAWGPAARPVARKRWGMAAIALTAFAGFAGCVLFVIHAAHIPAMEQVTTNGSHLLVAAAGAASVCVVAWLSRRPEPRRWVRWLCVGVLAAVIGQGILGGQRVALVSLTLAIVHACFAQVFFCLAAFTTVATSRFWARGDRPTLGPPDRRGFSGLARWAAVGAAVVLGQLIVGATMRHYDAGLAIPDLPLHYGKLLPPTTAAELDAANLWRAAANEPGLHPTRVTMTEIWLHFAHRCGAVLVSAVLATAIVKALRRRQAWAATRTPALCLSVLLVAQLTLGVLTVLYRKPADVASLHVACGALVLATTVVLSVRALRLAAKPVPATVVPDAVSSVSGSDGVTLVMAGRPNVDRDNAAAAVAVGRSPAV